MKTNMIQTVFVASVIALSTLCGCGSGSEDSKKGTSPASGPSNPEAVVGNNGHDSNSSTNSGGTPAAKPVDPNAVAQGPAQGTANATDPNRVAEATQAVVAFNTLEEGLQRVGLRFHTLFSYQNGVLTTGYSWDTDFLRDFFSAHPEAGAPEMIAALIKYVQEGESLLKRWGSFIPSQDEIKSKVDLAKATIKKLNE